MKQGVYEAKRIDQTIYYRASITYNSKHISLGSYDTVLTAHNAYNLAKNIISANSHWTIHNYPHSCSLPFLKWVVLINFRDNGIYFKNPIYLKKNYFLYYIDEKTSLTFDVDDLFYYAKYKIQKRGGYLFVADHGMQINILSRYGIRNHGVINRDYCFVNGDPFDYRYDNIEVINPYYGVLQKEANGIVSYQAKIHIQGNYLIGTFHTAEEAAIAYNKAADYLRAKGLKKDFPINYIEEIDEIRYASMYQKIRIPKKILEYSPKGC